MIDPTASLPANVRAHWWIPLVRGAVAILLGIVLFVLPISGVFTLVVLFGAFAFADGVLAIVQALRFAHPDTGRWWMLLVQGIVSAVIGVVAFLYPGLTAQTLGLLIAVWAVVTGLLEIGAAFRLRRDIPNELLLIVAGIVSIAVGVLIVLFPLGGLIAVVYFIAAYALIWGVALVALAFRLRGRKSGA